MNSVPIYKVLPFHTLPKSIFYASFLSNVDTIVGTSILLKSVYVCPVPTKRTGFPVTNVILSAAPTLSSMVSNLDRTIPSICRGFATPLKFCKA